MSSVQPLSSAAASALVFELETTQSSVYGTNPLTGGAATATAPFGGRLSRGLARFRESTLPRVMASLSTSSITVQRAFTSTDEADPLARRFVTTSAAVNALVLGPTTDTLNQGWLSVGDYEVVVAAKDFGEELTTKDSVVIGSLVYDVVKSQGYPQVPEPVAYRYWCKRVE